MFENLPGGKFDIIYADPPWLYQENSKGEPVAMSVAKPIKDHYPTLSLEELSDLDVASIASDDCLLFMWTTGPKLDTAMELGPAWGFKYVTLGFVWDKIKVNPGYYTMSQCEICLIFKRGRIPQPRGQRNIRQMLSEKRTAHSAKPNEIRKRIEAMFPNQKKLELFAREKSEGWTVWGNEIGQGD